MKIAMIILAAGFSRRMGVLKPLLPVGGESALIKTVRLGRHENIHTISVVTGHRYEDVEAELYSCSAKNIRHIRNHKYADGMFSSVKAGVHSLPGDIDGFFLLPVDHCAVTSDTMEKLITAFILSKGQAIVYPTCRGKRGHPPLIPYSFSAGIKDYDGADGLQGYLAAYPYEEVDTGDEGILLDMDTPDDYEALLRHLGLPVFPDEAACHSLFEKYETPDAIIEHGRQVGRLARHIAGLLEKKGVFTNRGLLLSACLLHDMLRFEPEHEAAAAKLLLQEGFPAAAKLVAVHMELPETTAAPDEAALLYLADKLIRDGRITPLEETVASLQSRYGDDQEALTHAKRRMQRAMEILHILHRQFQITYEDIAKTPL